MGSAKVNHCRRLKRDVQQASVVMANGYMSFGGAGHLPVIPGTRYGRKMAQQQYFERYE